MEEIESQWLFSLKKSNNNTELESFWLLIKWKYGTKYLES